MDSGNGGQKQRAKKQKAKHDQNKHDNDQESTKNEHKEGATIQKPWKQRRHKQG